MSIAKEQHGFGVRLIPVDESMSEEIINLRRSPAAQSFLGTTSPVIEDQKNWVKKQQSTEMDYYWAVGNKHGTCYGTISIYDSKIYPDHSLHAEWGRWVIRPQSHMALASFVLMLETAFERLGFESLKSATVATNARALAFHKRFGTPEVGVTYRALAPHESHTKMIEHCVRKEDWASNKDRWRASALSISHLAASTR